MENNFINNNIKIVRFKGGLDVVCHCNYMASNNDDKKMDIIELDTPMMFEVRNTNLVMQHWLPLALMKEKRVKIKSENVLCVFEPSDEFAEHYRDTVTKMNSFVNRKQTEDETQMMLEALDEIKDMDESNFH
jgi:hypothetical protein